MLRICAIFALFGLINARQDNKNSSIPYSNQSNDLNSLQNGNDSFDEVRIYFPSLQNSSTVSASQSNQIHSKPKHKENQSIRTGKEYEISLTTSVPPTIVQNAMFLKGSPNKPRTYISSKSMQNMMQQSMTSKYGNNQYNSRFSNGETRKTVTATQHYHTQQKQGPMNTHLKRYSFDQPPTMPHQYKNYAEFPESHKLPPSYMKMPYFGIPRPPMKPQQYYDQRFKPPVPGKQGHGMKNFDLLPSATSQEDSIPSMGPKKPITGLDDDNTGPYFQQLPKESVGVEIPDTKVITNSYGLPVDEKGAALTENDFSSPPAGDAPQEIKLPVLPPTPFQLPLSDNGAAKNLNSDTQINSYGLPTNSNVYSHPFAVSASINDSSDGISIVKSKEIPLPYSVNAMMGDAQHAEEPPTDVAEDLKNGYSFTPPPNFKEQNNDHHLSLPPKHHPSFDYPDQHPNHGTPDDHHHGGYPGPSGPPTEYNPHHPPPYHGPPDNFHYTGPRFLSEIDTSEGLYAHPGGPVISSFPHHSYAPSFYGSPYTNFIKTPSVVKPGFGFSDVFSFNPFYALKEFFSFLFPPYPPMTSTASDNIPWP